jgi:hypothetical protein
MNLFIKKGIIMLKKLKNIFSDEENKYLNMYKKNINFLNTITIDKQKKLFQELNRFYYTIPATLKNNLFSDSIFDFFSQYESIQIGNLTSFSLNYSYDENERTDLYENYKGFNNNYRIIGDSAGDGFYIVFPSKEGIWYDFEYEDFYKPTYPNIYFCIILIIAQENNLDLAQMNLI